MTQHRQSATAPVRIFLDADGSPVGAAVARIADSHQVKAFMVSGRGLGNAANPQIESVIAGGCLSSHAWIIAQILEQDICVTGDPKLAEACRAKGAQAIVVPGAADADPDAFVRDLDRLVRTAKG